MASPRDFPVLHSVRQRQSRRTWPPKPFHVCNVCGLTVSPRNSRRHNVKCSRLRRSDPALWWLWWCDMRDMSAKDTRKQLGPRYCAELVMRGHLVQGPLTKRGEL